MLINVCLNLVELCSEIFAGLLRCGKSCRLRWTNYLRPDLKRGLLSEYEEKMVIDLHSQLGNRFVLFFILFYFTFFFLVIFWNNWRLEPCGIIIVMEEGNVVFFLKRRGNFDFLHFLKRGIERVNISNYSLKLTPV